MKFVIVGGSGLIGRKLGKRLAEAGHEVAPASPSTGVNTLTGAGLAEVVKGAQVVVDVSNSPSFEDTAVMQFFETSTRNLVRSAAAAQVGHLAILSVVGTDRLADSGYLRAKLAQERMVKASGIPYSILRATQFFEFIGAIAEAGADGDSIRLTPALMQPVAADDVAAELAKVVQGPPLNGMVELGGPERIPMVELARQLLTAKGDTRKLQTDPQARYFGELLDDRSLTPGPDARLGSIHFADWLRGTTGAAKRSAG